MFKTLVMPDSLSVPSSMLLMLNTYFIIYKYICICRRAILVNKSLKEENSKEA